MKHNQIKSTVSPANVSEPGVIILSLPLGIHKHPVSYLDRNSCSKNEIFFSTVGQVYHMKGVCADSHQFRAVHFENIKHNGLHVFNAQVTWETSL